MPRRDCNLTILAPSSHDGSDMFGYSFELSDNTVRYGNVFSIKILSFYSSSLYKLELYFFLVDIT